MDTNANREPRNIEPVLANLQSNVPVSDPPRPPTTPVSESSSSPTSGTLLNRRRLQRLLSFKLTARRADSLPGLFDKQNHAHIDETLDSSLRGFASGDYINWLLSLHIAQVILLFAAAYAVSYLIFGILWYVIWVTEETCIFEVDGFNSAFLFAVETQTTIGYGAKYVSGSCEQGIILLVFHTICGLVLDALGLGILFAKLVRPKKRARHIICSRKAVLLRFDKTPCLMIRIGDRMNLNSPLVDITCHLYYAHSYTSEEGVKVPFKIERLELEESNPLLAVPTELIHRIDETSPLYGKTYADLEKEGAELILAIDGTAATLGLGLQQRASYSMDDVLLEHRFEHVISRNAKGIWSVDWNRFHNTVPVLAREPPRHTATESTI